MSFGSPSAPAYQLLTSPPPRRARTSCSNWTLGALGFVFNGSLHVLGTIIPTVIVNIGGAIKTALHFTNHSDPQDLTSAQTIGTLILAFPFVIASTVSNTYLNWDMVRLKTLSYQKDESLKYLSYIYSHHTLRGMIKWSLILGGTLGVSFINGLIAGVPSVGAQAVSWGYFERLTFGNTTNFNATTGLPLPEAEPPSLALQVSHGLETASLWTNFIMYGAATGIGIYLVLTHLERYIFMGRQDREHQLNVARQINHLKYLSNLIGISSSTELEKLSRHTLRFFSERFLGEVDPAVVLHSPRRMPPNFPPVTPAATPSATPVPVLAETSARLEAIRQRRGQRVLSLDGAMGLIPPSPTSVQSIPDDHSSSQDSDGEQSSIGTHYSAAPRLVASEDAADLATLGTQGSAHRPSLASQFVDRMWNIFKLLVRNPEFKEFSVLLAGVLAFATYRAMNAGIIGASQNERLSNFQPFLHAMRCEYPALADLWNFTNLMNMYIGCKVGNQMILEHIRDTHKEFKRTQKFFNRKTVHLMITAGLSSLTGVTPFMQTGGRIDMDPLTYLPVLLGFFSTIPATSAVSARMVREGGLRASFAYLCGRRATVPTRRVKNKRALQDALEHFLNRWVDELKRIEFNIDDKEKALFDVHQKLSSHEAFFDLKSAYHAFLEIATQLQPRASTPVREVLEAAGTAATAPRAPTGAPKVAEPV